MSDASTAPFRLEPDAVRCPYPHYEALRAQGAAVWVDELHAYVVSGYDDVTRILRHPDVASSRQPTGPGLAALTDAAVPRIRAAGGLSELAEQYLRTPTERTVFTIDPPRHTQMRRLISRILSPMRARQWEPMIREAADTLAAEFATAGRVDAVAGFARPLPEAVILPLLRMPIEMRDELRRWTRALTYVMGNPEATDADVAAMLEARAEMGQFFAEHLERVRPTPGDDLVTALVQACDDDGHTLTEGQRVGLLVNLLVAGNETSIKATSAAVRLLCEQPDVWERLKANRTKVATFVEESLRIEPPTQGMFRYLQEPIDIGATRLPAGSHVYLNFAAANRDASTFDDPTRVDTERAHALRHVSFGHGPHTCLGAWLARLEITIGIDALLDHVESIRLAPGNEFNHGPSYLLHGLERLDVDVTPVR